MAGFVVISIYIQINGHIMDLSTEKQYYLRHLKWKMNFILGKLTNHAVKNETISQ